MQIKPDGRKESQKGCGCDQCIEIRRVHRSQNKLRELGHPSLVTKTEYEQARRKLIGFKARGMSSRQMGRQINVSDSSITQIIAGKRFHRDEPVGTVRRTTYIKIMALEYTEPLEEGGKYTGARTSPIGTQRRMQALAAAGYAYTWIAELWGLNKATPARLAREDKDFVSFATYRRVKGLYEKYRYVIPEDVGVSKYAASRQRNLSRASGYAPASAWDDDLIDDPTASPEWTGACGSIEGWRIHRKYEMEFCDPCRKAKKSYDKRFE